MTSGGAHGCTSQTFNALDQATSVTPKGTSARSQTYAGSTQSMWLADGQTRFTNAGSIGITATATPSQLTTFTRDPAGRLISMKRGTQRAVYHYDARGSIDSLTDATPTSSTVGKAAQRYGYEPYGRLTTGTTGAIGQPFRWNSEYAINDYDYKIGARRYDASIARWTQTDPSGQEPNNYAYAGNDPINNADPSGLSFIDGLKEAAGYAGDVYTTGKAAYQAVTGDDEGLRQTAAGVAGGFFAGSICLAGAVALTGGTGGFVCAGVAAAGTEAAERAQAANE